MVRDRVRSRVRSWVRSGVKVKVRVRVRVRAGAAVPSESSCGVRKGLVETEAETSCSRPIARAKRLVRARDEGAVSSSCARPTPNKYNIVL